ncbi:hypothetical protein BJV82DRAFT_669010 [Fennellomyces sp. T-0311]|nr:hypothetical protein BJV82DRAFT_669010 [Fennellomyces sp. T-0311]
MGKLPTPKMWYYGCLLFASILALVCSILTIIKFSRQDFFAGTIDMARGDASHVESTITQRPIRSGQKAVVVFRKVILRCMCYPLSKTGSGEASKRLKYKRAVPIVCKGCGVGIQIAGIVDAYVPLECLATDACLSNLIGFFISCVYFTDPSIITVAREIARRIKRRYVDDYFPALPQKKLSFDPGRRRLSDASNRGSRRFFSADDASTISRLSSREDLRLSPSSDSSQNPSIHSQTGEPPANPHGIIMVRRRRTPKEVADKHHTSVTLAFLAQAKEIAAKEEAEETNEQPKRSRGRRYTYPHIDVQDPHGRLAELVNRVGSDMSSITSSVSSAEQQKAMKMVMLMMYHMLFPCMIRQEERERRMSMMPMHRISDDQSRKRAIESMTLNEFWAMDIVPHSGNLPQSPTTTRSGSMISIPHQAARNEQVQIVEPYKYPMLAMMANWILITIFRVKPPAQHEDPGTMEMVDITTGKATSVNAQKCKESTEPPPPPPKKQDSDMDDAPSGFFKRTSMRAVSFVSINSSNGEHSRRQHPIATPIGTPESYRNEDYFLRPDIFDSGPPRADDPKGKRPMLQRFKSFEREPPFFSLRPGKDNASRKSCRSAASSNSKAPDHRGEKFVLTVTDTGDGAEHEEILPVHPTDSGNDLQSPSSRPGLFRRVSDMPPWTKNPFVLHVLGRGASPSKSIRMAKHLAERVGDASIVKSMQRHNSTPPPATIGELSEDVLSPPPPSIPQSYTSTASVSSAIYAFPLEARPHPIRRKESHGVVETYATQVQVPKSLLLDDFGTDHSVDLKLVRRPWLSKGTRNAIQESDDIKDGFSYGVARVITVRNWEESDVDRVIIRQGIWDIELLIQTEIDSQ